MRLRTVLFIDDLRNPPPDLYNDSLIHITRSSEESINFMKKLMELPHFISFDHDLGGDDTAMVVVDWIIENALDGKISLPEGFDFKVHSANVIGGQNIESKMRNFLNSLKEKPKTFSQMVEEAKKGNEYWFEKAKLDLSCFVNEYLRENNLTEVEFANKINKPIEWMNKILSADEDVLLSDLVIIFRAMDKKVKVVLESI